MHPRLKYEQEYLRRNPYKAFFFDFKENPSEFHAYFLGSPDSPYDGKVFETFWRIPSEFPYRPPKITLLTKVFHPNISLNGEISLGILEIGWIPILSFGYILLSICSILDSPSVGCPYNLEATDLYERDKCLFNLKARDMTCRYALENNFGLFWN